MAVQPQLSLPSQQLPATSSEDQKLEINLKLKEDADSETYPVKIFISSYVELTSALQDFCGLDSILPVRLFCSE